MKLVKTCQIEKGVAYDCLLKSQNRTSGKDYYKILLLKINSIKGEKQIMKKKQLLINLKILEH